jgi:hypothetical protein
VDNIRREILDIIDCDHVTATKSEGQFSEICATDDSAIRMFHWSLPFRPARVTYWQTVVSALLSSPVAGSFKAKCTSCFRSGCHIARREKKGRRMKPRRSYFQENLDASDRFSAWKTTLPIAVKLPSGSCGEDQKPSCVAPAEPPMIAGRYM